MRKILGLLTVLTVTVLAACSGANEDDLVIGLECNYAPFNWTTNDETGEAIDGVNAYCDGYDVAIAQTIAEEMGRNLVIRKIDWDGLIPALTSGTIDAIIAGMSPTAERALVVNFSDAYFRSEQVLVVSNDSPFVNATSLEDFSGASVVAQMGTLQDTLIDQIPDVDHRDPLNDYPSLVAQVQSGITDALVAEYEVAQSIVSANNTLSLVSLGDNGFSVLEEQVTVSVAVRKEDEAMRDNINDILASIDEETRRELMDAAQARQPE